MRISDGSSDVCSSDLGFDYTAKGQSRLGPFTSHGAILLPAGGQGRIAIAALDVSGTHASGALDIVTGGFAGALDVAGGGFTGALRFRPEGDDQRVEGQNGRASCRERVCQ